MPIFNGEMPPGITPAICLCNFAYHQTSNIRHTLVGIQLVDHSDVVGALPVGAASTASSFTTSPGTPGYNGLSKYNCKTRPESFEFFNLVCLILEVLQYISISEHQGMGRHILLETKTSKILFWIDMPTSRNSCRTFDCTATKNKTKLDPQANLYLRSVLAIRYCRCQQSWFQTVWKVKPVYVKTRCKLMSQTGIYQQFETVACWFTDLLVRINWQSGPDFCLFLGVSSDCAQPITGNLSCDWPSTARAYSCKLGKSLMQLGTQTFPFSRLLIQEFPSITHTDGGWSVPTRLLQRCTGVILCMRPANERWRYNVTSSLIGWAHTSVWNSVKKFVDPHHALNLKS